MENEKIIKKKKALQRLELLVLTTIFLEEQKISNQGCRQRNLQNESLREL